MTDPHPPPPDVAAIAAELYAAPLGEFTAARTARAKAARDDGDRDLAARIGALPKPSASAWLVDLLAREHTDDVDRVIDLGARLRAAQEDSDRNRLRELGAERRRLLTEVTGVAADRSEETGPRASAPVLEEVQQTLQAAMADDDAAAAVRSGRLVRALAAEGLDPVDLTDAVAVGGRLDPLPRSTTGSAPAPKRDEAAAARKEAAARAADTARTAKHARRDADDLASAADDAESAAAAHAAAVADLHARLADLRQRLDAAEVELADARTTAEHARSTADGAARAADDAQREADAADEALRRPR